ncbi:MAG: hypothetical protein ABIE36_03195 [Candidatus Diapherotrites archaeon]
MQYTEEAYWNKVLDFSEDIYKISKRALKGKKVRINPLESAGRFFNSCMFAKGADDNPENWVENSNFIRVFLPVVYSDDFSFNKNPNYYLGLLAKLRKKEKIDVKDAELLREFSFRMMG